MCVSADEPANGEIPLSGSSVHESSGELDLPRWDSCVEDSRNLETKFSVVTKIVTPVG